MMYDKINYVPRPGSLREMVCSIIHDNRLERSAIEQFARMGNNALNAAAKTHWMRQYLYLTFPWTRSEDAKVASQMSPVEILSKAAEEGPRRIVPGGPVKPRKETQWRNVEDARNRS